MNIVKATRKYEDWLRLRLRIVEPDLRIKHEQMAAALFPFFRGTFYRWVQLWPEVCAEQNRVPQILGVGDLHVENFGTPLVDRGVVRGTRGATPRPILPSAKTGRRGSGDAPPHRAFGKDSRGGCLRFRDCGGQEVGSVRRLSRKDRSRCKIARKTKPSPSGLMPDPSSVLCGMTRNRSVERRIASRATVESTTPANLGASASGARQGREDGGGRPSGRPRGRC